MQLKQIKKGKWYETRSGTGECLSVGGTHPPSCSFNITHPFPRGRLHIVPRDVIREVQPPSLKNENSTDSDERTAQP